MGRLLIFDDEPSVGRMVQLIARRAGISARYCSSAGEFFRELEQYQPTHVLIDLVMPEFDGVEVLSRLALAGTAAGIIITSGLGGRVLQSARIAAHARGLRVIGVLPKPFSGSALRAMLASPPLEPPLPAPKQGQRLGTDDLERALENDEFFVVFQPKWLLAQRQPLGVEALVRWAHPSRGVIGPDEFIAFLEDSGHIAALTERVLQLSLDWFSQLRLREPILLEVNFSGAVISCDLPQRMLGLCDKAGVDSDRVVLELTETSQVCDMLDASDILNRLRIKGFGLAIDDFGIGYSSMSQLAMFPFTELKIDRSFVARMAHSDEMCAIVHSTIGLAKRMGIVTVAEGVEDKRTLGLLENMGCDAVQGFAIAQPMMPEQANHWLQANQP